MELHACLGGEAVHFKFGREEILAIEDMAGCGFIALYDILVGGNLGLCEIATLFLTCSPCGRELKAWENLVLRAGLLEANYIAQQLLQLALIGEAQGCPKVRDGGSFLQEG